MEGNKESKIALLIDADNAQSDQIKNILAEAGKHGKVTIRRIYGNWTDNRLSAWKTKINTFSIRPVQKFSIAQGKNSTDTAMIIDAMDILHSKNVSGFCIASSDSDYSGLAQRIREEGIFVMGVGEAKKTSDAFIYACDLFVFTENLDSIVEKEITEKPSTKKKTVTKKTVEKEIETTKEKTNLPINKITNKPIDTDFLIKAYEMAEDDSGLAYMGEIGIALRKLDPGFDSRTYGSATMVGLIKKLPELFELIYKDKGSSLYLKLKKQSM